MRVADGRGGTAVVVLAGSVLQCFSPTGVMRWALPRVSVSRLIAAGDLDGTGSGLILARTDTRTLVLLDLETGQERWRWRSDPGTFINDHAGIAVVPVAGGSRIVVCPTYAPWMIAFDLRAGTGPTIAWRHDGPWDAGFGPSVIAADIDGDGVEELILSSRMGTAPRTVDGAVDSDKLVLGRRMGLLYQAVHDLETGSLREQVTYAPDHRGRRVARPYGLLTARPLAPDEPASIVLASCQVEEYLAVTRRGRDGRLRRGWGAFIEKDWPRDERELRVHPGALVDLQGAGNPELVASLWEDGRWISWVVDPRRGWEAVRVELPDRVIWGSVEDEAGRVALVTSVERERTTGAPTRIELLDGGDLGLVGVVEEGTVVPDGDRPLPVDTAFMAARRGGAIVNLPAGGRGMAVVRWSRATPRETLVLAADGTRSTLVAGAAQRVASGGGLLLAARRDGSIAVDGIDGTLGRLDARGRRAEVVTAGIGADAPLAVAVAADRLRLVGASTGSRRGPGIIGRLASSTGEVLYVAEPGSPWMLAAHVLPSGSEPRWRIALDAPLDHPVLPLPGDRIALTLRTGVHTLATEIRDREGALIVRLPLGAYLHPPALLEDPADPLVLIDDHGILVAVDLAGQERWRRDWTAAYSMPMTGPFGRAGRPAIVRANGIHGSSGLDRAGRMRWRRPEVLWRLAAGRAARFESSDGPVIAMPTRDGWLEAITAATGALRWSYPLEMEVEHVSVTTGDVDGDGRDELIVGLPDGRLLVLAEDGASPSLRWSIELDAGITDAWLTRVGERGAGMVVCTTDGDVRMLVAR
jgi:outer membrane protein assembly factor BamB